MATLASDIGTAPTTQTDFCPWCEQPISRKEFERITGRIRRDETKKLETLKKQMAEEAAKETVMIKQAAEKQILEAVESAKKEALDATSEQLKAAAQTLADERKTKAGLEQTLERLEEEKGKHTEAIQAAVATTLEASAKEHQNDVTKIRELLAEEAERVTAKQQAEFRREKEKVEKRLNDVQRQLQKKTANDLGDGAEVDLLSDLRDAFTGDRIQRIKKGQPGADIRHEVVDNGEVCGVILYDSKAHKAWRNTWVTKLREDQVDAEADFGVLTTTQFPSGEKEFCVSGDVLVVNPGRAVALVSLLRATLMQTHTLRLSNQERATKMERVFEYVRSEAFAIHLRRSEELTDEILQIDVDEQKAHKRVWQKRGEAAKSLARQIAELQTEITSRMRD